MWTEVDGVARGQGWSITHDRGSLYLHVGEGRHTFSTGKGGLGFMVELPPSFVTEFLRQKKDLRAGDERAREARVEAPPPRPRGIFVLEEGVRNEGVDQYWVFATQEAALVAARKLMAKHGDYTWHSDTMAEWNRVGGITPPAEKVVEFRWWAQAGEERLGFFVQVRYRVLAGDADEWPEETG